MKSSWIVGRVVRVLCRDRQNRLMMMKSSGLRRWLVLCWIKDMNGWR